MEPALAQPLTALVGLDGLPATSLLGLGCGSRVQSVVGPGASQASPWR